MLLRLIGATNSGRNVTGKYNSAYSMDKTFLLHDMFFKLIYTIYRCYMLWCFMLRCIMSWCFMLWLILCFDIVTSWGMFTNIKPHGKNILSHKIRQVRCHTNLPPDHEGYMFQVQVMIINLSLMREGIINLPPDREELCLWFPELLGTLQILTFCVLRAFGT